MLQKQFTYIFKIIHKTSSLNYIYNQLMYDVNNIKIITYNKLRNFKITENTNTYYVVFSK